MVVSCGSRHKQLTNESVEIKQETKTEQNSTTEQKTKENTSESIYKFLSEAGLNIESDGKPYTLDFNGLKFNGSANLSFNNKASRIEEKKVRIVETTYKSITTYKTQTNYRTKNNLKNLDVERKGVSFGGIIGIIVVTMIISILLWELLKKQIKFK